MIIGLQILALLFSLAMIYFALIHYKKGTINGLEILSWIVIWLFAILAVIFPDLLRVFAQTFLFTRLFDLMVVGGFFLVIILSAKAFITTRKLEKKVEELVRRDALRAGADKRRKEK